MGKECSGRQTQRKKEISIFFVDSSYFPLTPKRVEELLRSFIVVPLMVHLLFLSAKLDGTRQSQCYRKIQSHGRVACWHPHYSRLLFVPPFWGALCDEDALDFSLSQTGIEKTFSSFSTWVAKISLWVLQEVPSRIKRNYAPCVFHKWQIHCRRQKPMWKNNTNFLCCELRFA